jgi:hypothetical protein
MAESLTQRHRAQQLLLRRSTDVAVDRAWPRLDFDRLDATYPALALDVSRIVERNRRTSAGLTAAYLREFRREQRVGGTPKIELVRSLNVDQFNASLSTTSVASIKKATAEGRAADLAMRNALVLAQGAMARLVLNAGRDTLLASLAADSRAVGYERVLGGAGCEFCQMLAGRGDVYSAESADFEAHDHCGCTAEPVYRA